MRFFLTGFMGCGKTFWGRKIAQTLHLHFIDLDDYIESKEYDDIVTIFKTKGEDYFRLIEKQCLEEIIQNHTTCIISCGGGTPCYADNIKMMNENGITIYLKASLNFLFTQLLHEKEKRPLIADLEETDIKKYISNTLLEREKYYHLAKYHIDIEHASILNFKTIMKQYV